MPPAVVLAVTELVDGDTASKVVELIYKVGWPNPEVAMDRVERVVKVHNMDKSVDRTGSRSTWRR